MAAQVKGSFYVNSCLEELLFDELRCSCGTGATGYNSFHSACIVAITIITMQVVLVDFYQLLDSWQMYLRFQVRLNLNDSSYSQCPTF